MAPGSVRWGAAVDGNGDPAKHEGPAGRSMGLRRTFYQWSDRAGKMATVAAADLAAGRVPWVSTKTPGWSAMASGALDGEIDQMIRALDALNGPVWLTVHHEPEGGAGVNSPDDPGGPAAWQAMQVKVRQRIDALGADNISFAPILMSWTFNPASGRNPADWWVPGIWDLAGIDHYMYDEAKAGMVTADWLAVRSYYGARGLDLAVGEWGNRGTDTQATAEMQQFYDHALGSATDGRGSQVVGLSYFDSDLNSPQGGWTLQGGPLTLFRQLMSGQASLLADRNG